MKKKKTFVTKSLFEAVKQAIKDGKQKSTIMDFYSLSQSTYSRIFRATDWTNYKEIVSEMHGTVKAQPAPPTATTTHEDIALILNYIKALSEEFKDLKKDITNLNETYAWVVEHAQIDTSKKRSWLR